MFSRVERRWLAGRPLRGPPLRTRVGCLACALRGELVRKEGGGKMRRERGKYP